MSKIYSDKCPRETCVDAVINSVLLQELTTKARQLDNHIASFGAFQVEFVHPIIPMIYRAGSIHIL